MVSSNKADVQCKCTYR